MSRRRDQEFADAIGARVRRARRRAGMSQEQLAKAAGLHRTTIGLIEKGRRTPSYATLSVIIGALELDDPQELFDGITWMPAAAPAPGSWRIDPL